MYRVTTPTHTYTLPMDTATLAEIQVTYKQGSVILVKHYQDGAAPPGMTVDADKVMIRLTQEETKAFAAPTPVRSQVRVLTDDGSAYASQQFSIAVGEVLNEEVLADEHIR